MNIFDSPLGKDVKSIIDTNGMASTSCHLKMMWNVSGYDSFEVRRIHSMQTTRDYRDGSFDSIEMIVEVSVQDYQNMLYPNRAKLEVDLFRTKASDKGVYLGNPTIKTKYKAFLLTLEDHELFDQSYSGINQKEKESNTINIGVQLLDYNMYRFKDVCYSTVLGPGLLEDYLYYFMSHRGTIKCSIHPPDNTDDTDNIVIPEGIELINLANWIQQQGPGIYNHGINTYFQDGMMYVYPIALLESHEYRRSCNVFRAGSEIGIGTGNTYAVINGTLNLISSGEVPVPDGELRQSDDREQMEQTFGNSTRWHDPRYQSNIIDPTGDLMTYTSAGTHLYGLPDADVKIQRIHKLHTVNGYYQRSIINKTLGRVITIPWQSGDISLMEPGTEVKYHYMHGYSMEMIDAIVDGTMEYLKPMESFPSGNIFNIESVLRLRMV